MRLFDLKSSHWAIRHICAIMAAKGFAILVIAYPLVGYLSVRDQELADECGFDCIYGLDSIRRLCTFQE